MESGKNKLLDAKVETKIVLSGLWVVIMLLYVYCDIFSLYQTGQVEKIISGKMGFLDINQASLAMASVLMMAPIIMIGLCLILPAGINRAFNIVVGVIYLIVNSGNMVGETWVYYYLFGVCEITVVVVLIIRAIRWPVEK